jgi:pyruvate dehydrogenase E2 component (dihydrolipoamide acetyltransferase)
MGGGGVEYFTPILNNPEVGILGVGALQKELKLDEEGNVKEHSMIPLSLSFDHQIIDGSVAGEFLITLARYIEHPYLLVL